MSTSARSIYASAPFKFIVDGNALYIHAELVSQNSKPLDRMINGHMSEAREGFAVIEDVDEGTFVRFIQWAYNGYYGAGEFKIDSPRPDSAPLEEKVASGAHLEEPASAADAPYPEEPPEYSIVEIIEESEIHSQSWTSSGDRKKSGMKEKKRPRSSRIRQLLKERFINRQPTVRQQAISICPPRPNQASNENYTEVFLSHARVYVFADQYDIQLLKALALDELHGTLQNFYLYPERSGDIIALLRYVYTKTGETVELEDIRTILTRYIGFEMDMLMEDKGFRDLMMEDGGPLLGDFLKMVKQRI